LIDRQIAPPHETLSLDDQLVADATAFSVLSKPWRDPEQRLRALCEVAVNAKTIAWPILREGIVAASAAFGDQWPSIPLTVTAVNVDTYSLQAFNAGTGANILDAIAASCSVPGFWPPVPIGDHRYIDGGLWRTGENAHLAAHASSVLIISPFAYLQSQRSENHSWFEDDVAMLRSKGARVATIVADAQSLSTLGSRGVLDSSTNKAAAEAGRAQGRREAAALQTIFASSEKSNTGLPPSH
jgi:NTE family protein